MKAEYVDHMGDDLRVVNAARVSFKKESKEFVGQDERLINYLAKHNHWTPFSHPMITMREKVPIFVARQRFKHMVGFTYNEVSRRYVDDEPEFYVPEAWRSRPEGSVKQGSGNKKLKNSDLFVETDGHEGHFGDWEYDFLYYEDLVRYCSDWYKMAVESGVAPEQARMILPQSMYTEYYVTGSLAAWARAYKLRIDPHAQKEIQELAEQWGKIIEPLFPVSWKALCFQND